MRVCVCVCICVRVYFSVRVVFTRVCARVSDWPGTGRFKTIRLVNISVAGSLCAYVRECDCLLHLFNVASS